MSERTGQARSSARSDPVRVRFDRFELDEANARLLANGRAIALARGDLGFSPAPGTSAEMN
jgi:hypothetical protein